jgi:PAS domain-containing protein
VTISAEGKITDVNEATIRVTGVARGHLVGTDFSDYFTEPDLAREGYRQVFAQGFVTDYPLTIRHTWRRADRGALQRLGVQGRGRPCSACSPPPATSPPRSGLRVK